MDDVNPTIAPKEESPAPSAKEEVNSRALFTWQTLLATVVMGTIGYFTGKTLGKWGSRPGSDLSTRVMSWAGAGTGAVLAAYTSTKVLRKEQSESRDPVITIGAANDTKPLPASAKDQPVNTLTQATIAHEGNVQTVQHEASL